MRNSVPIIEEALPVIHSGHPVWYRGQLAGVAANGEVTTIGWLDAAARLVVRALAAAVFEAPQLDPDQQFSFASYCLLPDEIWNDMEGWPDELIERIVGVPADVIRRRRSLPSLGATISDGGYERACA